MVVVVVRLVVVGLFRSMIVASAVGVVAARFNSGGGRSVAGLHSFVNEVKVLCQAEHSDQRSHILVDVLLLQELHLPGNGAIDARSDLIGKPSDGLASVQHWV